MITGFNTDVEYEGVTYHVQTEDKGLDTPLILSLVYNRGTILASKRSPYEDLINLGFDEKVLSARLQKQHKLICAAVRAGRIEDLKRMTMKESALKQKGLVAERTIKNPKIKVEEPEIIPQKNVDVIAKNENLTKDLQKKIEVKTTEKPITEKQSVSAKIDNAKNTPDSSKEEKVETKQSENKKIESAIPKPNQELIWKLPVQIIEDEHITEGIEIIEEELILPDEAVEIVTEFTKSEPPETDKLRIEFLTETTFRGGERKTVSIFVGRGNQEYGIGSAQVMVKVLGSSFRPMIFHAKTDSNGVATVHLQLPHFRAGRAAILVRAISGGEEAEIRRVISHG